jgi:hypothetical protein
MDNKELKSILQDALEEQMPASQVNLLPAVQARLVARKQSLVQQGENMNKIRNQKLIFSAIAIVALLAVALITPQGRAFAQSVLHLFTRAESDTLPLQPWQIPPSEIVQADSTALPPSQLITIIADAERLAGFDAAELVSTPEGFTFLGARLYGNVISLEYEAQGGGGNLIIMQSREGYVQSDWDKVPPDAVVTPVKVGELDGEFVQGTFVAYAGDTLATWNPEAAILRLRWIRDGIWFEMTKFGDVESIEYLDQAGLIELAKNMTFAPSETNSNPYPLSMEEATELAEYQILVPGQEVLTGYQFNGAAYDPKNNMVSLFYANAAGEGFMVSQQKLGAPEDIYPLQGIVGASAPIEAIEVGNFQGEYIEGVWELTDNGPVWRAEPFLKTLRWKTDMLWVEIVYQGMEMAKNDLIALAESMK